MSTFQMAWHKFQEMCAVDEPQDFTKEDFKAFILGMFFLFELWILAWLIF